MFHLTHMDSSVDKMRWASRTAKEAWLAGDEGIEKLLGTLTYLLEGSSQRRKKLDGPTKKKLGDVSADVPEFELCGKAHDEYLKNALEGGFLAEKLKFDKWRGKRFADMVKGKAEN